MAQKRQYHSSRDLITHIKSLSQAQLDGAAARVAVAHAELAKARRALQIAHCEDSFSKLDNLLPTHDTSRVMAFQLLARLCASKPNLAQ